MTDWLRPVFTMGSQRAIFGKEPSLMVDESLEGLCLLTPGIQLVADKRIVVREDLVSSSTKPSRYLSLYSCNSKCLSCYRIP